ncbi:MAG: transcriptional regulator [Verrucomicrobiia bacterium]
MMVIYQRISSRRYPNASTLAKELEISRKTIVRDIAFMRYRLNLPITFDSSKNGYVFNEPVAAFPLLQVTAGELVALFVARKALEQYRGTPFEIPLANALNKISAPLQETVSFSWQDLEGVLSFSSGGRASPDIGLFDHLSHAVLESVEVTFDYCKLNSRNPERRQVQPYHLACISGQWYLFAHDKMRNRLRTFVLSRMKNLQRTSVRFERPPDFSLERLLANSFGVFEGRHPVQIAIRFDAYAAQLIRERRWHASQRIEEQENGGLVLHLVLGGFQEIEPWILSWGSHAEVIEPKDLRQKLRQSLQMSLDHYKASVTRSA